MIYTPGEMAHYELCDLDLYCVQRLMFLSTGLKGLRCFIIIIATLLAFFIQITLSSRGHPGAFREGEVLRQFQDFREKF